MTQSIKPLILLGAGGHAKVLLSLINALNLPVAGVFAPELQGQPLWRGVPVLGNGEDLSRFNPQQYQLVNGIGKKVGDTNRQRIFKHYHQQGYLFATLIHPQAWVDESAYLDEGVQVMAGAIIQADARIGCNVIINTHASVDHDCVVEDHVHIAPGAVLCGNVHIGHDAFIASGAHIIPGVRIAAESIIGAGASVVRSVETKSRILPARVRQLADATQATQEDTP